MFVYSLNFYVCLYAWKYSIAYHDMRIHLRTSLYKDCVSSSVQLNDEYLFWNEKVNIASIIILLALQIFWDRQLPASSIILWIVLYILWNITKIFFLHNITLYEDLDKKDTPQSSGFEETMPIVTVDHAIRPTPTVYKRLFWILLRNMHTVFYVE